MFTPDFIQHVRLSLSITDVVGQHVRLIRKGRMIQGLCPFHQEKTPSFVVYEDKGSYHCFGCGAHGDPIAFMMAIKKISFVDAVKELAQRAHIALPQEVDRRHHELSPLYELLKQAALFYHRQLFTDAGKRALTYGLQRGITQESIKQFEIGFAPDRAGVLIKFLEDKGFATADMVRAGLLIARDDGRYYERFRGRFMFPILDPQGRVVGFGGRSLGDEMPKYLNSSESPLFTKRNLLYGYKQARDSKDERVLVVEGYMDVVALHQAGFKGAVATLGTSLTPYHLPLLWKLHPEPVLCFDGDQAGKRAALRALEVVLPTLKPGNSLRFMFLPQGEDPDSLMRGGQQDLFSTFMQKSLTLVEVLWQSMVQQSSLQTPEQKAAFRRSIADTIKRIEDITVREAYRDEMGMRMDQLFRPQPKAQRRTASKETLSAKRPTSGAKRQQQILLAAILHYPELLDHIREELAFLEVDDKAWCTLQQALLVYDDILAVENLNKYLVAKYLQDVIEHITNPSIQAHAYFLRKETPINDVLQAWQMIFSDLRQKHTLSQDLSEAKQELSRSMSSSEWQKVKLLTALRTQRSEAES